MDRRPCACILLIEDNPDHAGPAADLLRRYHEVVVVPLLDEGLTVLASRPVDVVVLDLGGTGADGAAGVVAVREASPLAEVVVWSGWSDDVLENCLDRGASSVVPKPSGLSALRWAVESALPSRGCSWHSLRALAVDVRQALTADSGAHYAAAG